MGKDLIGTSVDCVVGIESRGFILGAALAAKYDKGFILVRKRGKLPPPVTSQSYTLEYGDDTLEMKPNQLRKMCSLWTMFSPQEDTLKATIALCEKNNYHVKGVSMLINLKFLNDLEGQIPDLVSVLNYK